MSEYPFEKRVSEKFGKIYEPTIPVEIIGPKKAVEVLMILDSGADISLLPHWIAEMIGLRLDVGDRRSIHGVGGETIPYILSTVRMNESRRF